MKNKVITLSGSFSLFQSLWKALCSYG